MTKDIEKILARKCETLDDGRIVIVPDMSDWSDLVDELNALFLLHGVGFELPDQKEIITFAAELSKKEKQRNDKVSMKDYMFGLIDGARWLKEKIQNKGN